MPPPSVPAAEPTTPTPCRRLGYVESMRVLVVGSGGVGSAFVAIASHREVYEHITVADIDLTKAEAAVATAVDNERGDRIVAATIDASSEESVAELARSMRADVILNACDPRFNPPIFDGAFLAGCHYVDMAMHLSTPHPERPYEKCGVRLGDGQFAQHPVWKNRRLMALVGMGVEPGFSDVAARYAADHLFSKIDEIGVRDGADLVVEGYDFAPTFSIWTTIEECLNPPVIYERERGWFTTEPFSEPEIFTFPGGIGPVHCVNVEHEEVILIPRWIDAERVTFKYGLGDEFIDVLKTLQKLDLHSTEPISVRGTQVSPRDVVAAALPDPAELGSQMTGRTCAGTWVKGTGTDGAAREVYVYHVVDNAWSMREFGHQAVVWQTAVMPAVAIELMATGVWAGVGIVGPEALPPDPFLDLLDQHGVGWAWEDYVDRAPAPSAPAASRPA
jgi:saccharopine dehydrogenase (NAD+, L-lysine forming)